MEPLILEGTWEEILKHHKVLAGKRVRVIVLGSQPLAPLREEPQNLRDFLGDFVGSVSVEPPPTAENTNEVFSEIVARKHSRESRDDSL